MSTFPSHTLRMIGFYTEASEANREELAELRRLADLDQQRARAEDLWFLAVQDWTLSANGIFDLQSQLNQTLRKVWFELSGPYDVGMERSLIEGYRRLLNDSEELLDSISLLKKRGRTIEGAELFEENMRNARAILEDEVIREQSERLMPELKKLDALASAHHQSTGQ